MGIDALRTQPDELPVCGGEGSGRCGHRQFRGMSERQQYADELAFEAEPARPRASAAD
jgi:hypothetical protein